MEQSAPLRGLFNASAQSYILNVINSVKSITAPMVPVAIPVEATSFDNVCPNLVARLSVKMDSMDKPERLRVYRA